MTFDIKSLDDSWHHIIHEFTGYSPTTKAGQPCPICSNGSKSDRFHYTNKHSNGTWLCRQCTPEGSDGIGLIARLNREDRKETYKKIAQKYDPAPLDTKKYPKAEPEPEFVPIPTELNWDGKTLANKLRDDGSPKKYNFAYIWKWNNPDGSQYGYVARMEWIDKDSGEPKKLPWQILFGYYENDPDNIGFHQVAMQPKPLFGYPSVGLSKINPKYIVIVEGEKTTMAAKKLLGPDYLVLCCQGGSSNVRATDLEPLIQFASLREIPIIAWGDNDAPGDKYAAELKNTIGDIDIVRFPHKPEKWDAADASENDITEIEAAIIEAVSSLDDPGDALQEIINDTDNFHDDDEPYPKETKDEVLRVMHQNKTESTIDQLLKHVNPLGVCEGQYVFYPKNLKYVMAFSASSMMQAANMISILGEDLLSAHFPKKNEDGDAVGYNCSAASRYLMNVCHKRGTYDPDQMRGIGVWKDSGKFVVNTGAELVIDGTTTAYDDFQSKYTYAQPGVAKIKLDQELTDADKEIIKEILYSFNWTKKYHAHLMLGALIQAPVAAALRWRAHVWLGGPQGVGKSFLQSSFVRALLGHLCINFGGETTAAGVRQALKHNPFVVSFDEAEVRSEKDAKRMKDIISLARISSSDDNNVVKGSANGDAMEYRCQSPFIMSSIKSCLREESDIARFAALELSQPGNTPEDRETFARVKELCYKIDAAFSERFIATCINNLGLIEELIQETDIALAKKNLNARTRDQYGQLIGCAKLFIGDINLDDFDETLDEAREHTADREPLGALNKLLNFDIRIPSKYGDKTMTIRHAIKLSSQHFIDDSLTPEDVQERLAKYGLKIFKKYLYIANTNDQIELILGFPEWNKLFKIINGAEMGGSSTSFGSRDYKCRYVKIPCELFASDNSDDLEHEDSLPF